MSFKVVDAVSGQAIEGADITAIAPNNEATFIYTSDANGQAIDNAFLSGVYDVFAGKWGYITAKKVIYANGNSTSVTMYLQKGYYDDFLFDNGWTVVGNVTSGRWERGIPRGTEMFGNTANPDKDLPDDFGLYAFVTGNQGFDFYDDQVAEGVTVLGSPAMDLSTYSDPVLIYDWWQLSFDVTNLRKGEGTLKVEISDGATTEEVAFYHHAWRNRWNPSDTIHIKDFFPNPNAQMRVFISAEDPTRFDILECGLDGFFVFDAANPPTGIAEELGIQVDFAIYPNPVLDQFTLGYDLKDLEGKGSLSFELYDLRGAKLMTTQLAAFQAEVPIGFPFSKGLYLGVMKLNGEVIASRKIVK